MRLRGYPRERLLVALVCLAALPVLNPANTQDASRLSLSESFVTRGRLDIDRYHELTVDRAHKDGHWYSDKAPGVSALAVPPVLLVHGVDALRGLQRPPPLWRRPVQLWVVRVVCGGLAFGLLVLLLGRLAEGAVPGTGAGTAVVFGAGTMAGALAATTFGHEASALLLLAAFVAVSRRRHALGGLLGGLAVAFEYPAALGVAILCVLAVRRSGRRGLSILLGAAPPVAALAAYQWAAFGSPFRLPYAYVANRYSESMHHGFFGIGTPTLRGAWLVLFDGRGVFSISPVLVLAALGLVEARRSGCADALWAGILAAVYLVYPMAYFLPYGGTSPGPRFALPAVAFLALGLPFAFARRPRLTAAAALVSVGIAWFDEITWGIANAMRLEAWPETVWSRAGAPAAVGAFALLGAALAASLVAWTELGRARILL